MLAYNLASLPLHNTILPTRQPQAWQTRVSNVIVCHMEVVGTIQPLEVVVKTQGLRHGTYGIGVELLLRIGLPLQQVSSFKLQALA